MIAAVGRLERLAAAQLAHAVVVDAREGVLARRVERAAFRAALRRANPAAVRPWASTGVEVLTVAEPVRVPEARLLARRIVALRAGAAA